MGVATCCVDAATFEFPGIGGTPPAARIDAGLWARFEIRAVQRLCIA